MNAVAPYQNLFRRSRRLGVAILLLVTSALAQDTGRTKLDKFARCLAERKATLYGSFLCPHCDDQRKLFGASFAWISYVECSKIATTDQASQCRAKAIRFTPTWLFVDGERRTGVQSLKQLSDKTGCPLP